MLQYLLFFVAISLVIVSFFKQHRFWKIRGVKCKTSAFYFGEFWEIMTKSSSFADLTRKLYNFYPDHRCYGTHLHSRPVLILKDPDLVKHICIKDADAFINHMGFLDFEEEPLWSKNLFNLKGEAWKSMRSAVSPSFSSGKIKLLTSLMMTCAKNYVDYFSNQGKDLIEVEALDIFRRFAMDIIAVSAFGIEVNSIKDRTNEFHENGTKMHDLESSSSYFKMSIISNMPKLAKFLNIRFIDPSVESYFKNTILDSIEYRRKNKIVRQDLLNLLLNTSAVKTEQEVADSGYAAGKDYFEAKSDRRQLNTDEIISQSFIFFLAGLETVSTALSVLAYELSVNPDIQDRLRNEIDEVMRTNENITYENLVSMTYLDMVVSEILRKYPPFMLLDRACVKRYDIQPTNEKESLIRLEPGMSVAIPIVGFHWDPKYYPNPEKFDPERFSSENKKNITPYTYMPFGMGPRNCVGSRFALMEIKAIYFFLLSQFEIVPIKKTQIPFKYVKGTMNVRMEGGFWFGFKKRHLL